MSIVSLPVSIGEALDKLTILDIKMSKIQDQRRADVEKEHGLLFAQLEPYVRAFPYYYSLLRQINQTLWDIQDEFHGKLTEPGRAAAIAHTILDENDRRFRVKLKINTACSSTLKEQKGYAKKRAFVYGHLGLGDMFWMNGAVRYLATAFDEVVVVVKKKNSTNVSLMYADDPTIKFCAIENDENMYPFTEARKELESEGYTVFACGGHAPKPRIYEFPLSFYDDFGLARSVRQDYFHIPDFPEATALWESVTATAHNYCVIHEESTTGTLDLWAKASEAYPTLPVLDVNKNHYQAGHPWHSIGELVVGKPLVFYKKLLENATAIYMIESSFYCMTSHLNLSRVERKLAYRTCDNSETRIGVFETGA